MPLGENNPSQENFAGSGGSRGVRSEYGPDASTNSTTRGPAGVIEWNRITKPGFFGWPLCVGDNSAANRNNPDPKVDVLWGDQTWQEMQYTGVLLSPN